ncbi:CD2 antigen cytoplasmic tail-binding 2, putative [Babesia ovata]|uniref:CD2 antigen cytoplasmic tail-binding 2, putative n=1 Tax=Babesia ovata TaxID=189622 RepID=A0A2H6K6R3_9APIC|nr:CD2 antigen cytoplasmic tail-binding 2, putative [Babesia ovata]GBE58675.1 CD2 antigen cytoplasmic tail-binding 2, putative [Babesia ovata]
MYLPHEINRIKDQRRLRQRGIAEPSDLSFGDGDLDYEEKSSLGATGDAEADHVEDEDGVTIEPFHMRREMEEGAFDTAGTYLENNRKMTSTNKSLNRDEGDDPWVASLEEQNSLSFKSENSAFYAKQPVRASASSPDLMEQLQDVPTIDIIKRLIALLEPGETPVDALKVKRQRSGKRCLPGFRKQERNATDASQGADTKDKKGAGPNDLSKYDVSDLAHVLTIIWQNVYYMTKEDIRNSLAAAKNRPKRGGKSAPPTRYQFRWVRGDGTIYGPCSEVEILSWIAHDYISDDNPVELREVGPDATPLDEAWIGYRKTALYNFLNPERELPGGVKGERSAVNRTTSVSDAAGKDESGDNADNSAASGGVSHSTHCVGEPSSSGINEEESDDEDDDGTFAKRRRKDELIGLKPKTKKVDDDSGASDDDDEPDIE